MQSNNNNNGNDSEHETWQEEDCYNEVCLQHEEKEREFIKHRETSMGTVWGAFQDSAQAVAYLYKERSFNLDPDPGVQWYPFQAAASTVTTLFRESCEALRRTSESALHCGYQKRSRELATWVMNKRRRMIRRDDLLAYLAGKQLPLPPSSYANRRSPKPEHTHTIHTHHSNPSIVSQHPATHTQHSTQHTAATITTTTALTGPLSEGTAVTGDSATFKEIIGSKPRGPELFSAVANEISRQTKRPGSPVDDKMDDCHFNKRQRFM